jgi:hypothetical protein
MTFVAAAFARSAGEAPPPTVEAWLVGSAGLS